MQVCMKSAGPKSVAIIGGGPSGLSLAIALLRLPTGVENIKIFEQFSAVKPNIGGGVQLNGGAAMLDRLGLGNEIRAASNRIRRIRSRSVGGRDLLDINLPSIVRASPSARELIGADGDVTTLAVMRDSLQDVLFRALPRGLVDQRRVAQVEEGRRPACIFADGSREEFDLVVGCDGIRSTVRDKVVGPRKPIYAGLRIQFAVSDARTGSSRPAEEQDTLHQWLGDGGYALLGTYGGIGGVKQDMVALVTTDKAAKEENVGWSSQDLRANMLSQMEKLKIPSDAVKAATLASRCYELGVYLHNPIGPWSRGGGICLAGDSAHAMPPFLGQGANQALQDSYALAERLTRIGTSFSSTKDALWDYTLARQPQTAYVTLNSWFLGSIEAQSGAGAVARDLFFQATGKLGIAQYVYLSGAIPRV